MSVLTQLIDALASGAVRVVDLSQPLGPDTPVIGLPEIFAPSPGVTIETELPGATLSFRWCFDAVSDRRTRLTQRIVLAGSNAAAYVSEMEQSFGANLQAGMEKIAATIATAAARVG